MADRSRWFESLSVPRLWRRLAGHGTLGVLEANDVGRRRGHLHLTDDEPAIAELPLREGRTFPPDMPRPGGEYGATGTPIFGGFIAGEDYNPQLDGAKALLVYDEMRRSDAQVNATMRVLKLPLKAASWDIDPPDGSTDPQDQAIADFCASALFDDDAMAHPWGYAMHHILLKLDFGVSILEKVFTVGELGEIRFHRLAPRLPKTIFRWIIDPETGALEAIVQFAPKGGAYQYLTIPAMYCLGVNERILTADLRWVPSGELKAGDQLFAFDEEPETTGQAKDSPRRRWKFAEITASQRATAECVRVHLSDGTSVVCTDDHPWLVDPIVGMSNHRQWVQAKDLMNGGRGQYGPRRGHYVIRALRTWKPDESYDAGWLAGIFDGEGCLSFGREGSRVSAVQVDGPVQDAIAATIRRLGFAASRYQQASATKPRGTVEVNGGFDEQLRFLGTIRPKRLLADFERKWKPRACQVLERVQVVAVEPIGPQPIQRISTSARTYVGEGFLMHNCAVFCHEREGDNYFGRSVLRSAYQHWWRKKQLYDLDSVRLDRYGIGIPRAAIEKDHRPSDAELAQIKKILRGLRSHDRGYLIQPYGVVFDILVPNGGRAGASGGFDSINHHNFMISANILAAFLNDPSASKGSKAHTQTLADIFQDSLQAIADDTGGDILSQLVRPLCDLNFDMTGRKYPVVRASGLDSVDGNDLAVAFQRLGPSMANPRGFVSPDDDLEDWFRDQFNAPPRSAAATATDAPPNEGGVEDPNPSGTAASPDTPGAAVSSKPARSAPAASPAGASRLASGTQTTEAKDGQVQKGDSGGNVTAQPLKAAPFVKAPQTTAPTTIDLDPTTRGGVGKNGPTAASTTYGYGGARKQPAKRPLKAPWPEGPLGPVKVPPPPGGAMGAPPLGVDNAVGNNEGFPLGLSDDQYDDPQPLTGDVLAHALKAVTTAGWTNDHDSAIQRRYEFANSRRAAAFVAAVSEVANKVNHHPDLTVDHEHVSVRFTTRQAGNQLTPKDFGAAAACDKLATWANDLALRGDPVVIDGRSFGRAPTQREEQIFNFREIPDRLDQERDALAKRLQALRKEQLAQLIADVVKRDANPKTGAFTDIRPDKTPIPLANDVYLAIRAAQGHVAKYGALQVRSELQKQGAPVTAHGGRVNLAGDPTQKAGAGMQKQISSLVTSARITANKLNQQLLTAVLDATTRLRRGGLQGDDLAQAVTDEVSDTIDAGVARAVGQEVNEAFGVGRQTEATANQDLIGTVVRSALLDGNTCDRCDEMDGTEWDADDPDIVECPDPDCEGRDSCRCVNLYTAKGE